MAHAIPIATKEIPELLHCAFSPGAAFADWLQELCNQFRRVMAGADATIGLTEYERAAMIEAKQRNFHAGARMQRLVESIYPDGSNLSAPVPIFLGYYFPRSIAATHSEIERKSPPLPQVEHGRTRFGIADIVGMVLHPAPGLAATISSALDSKTTLDRGARTLLTHLGLHLETALRLRLHAESVRAVLSPSGKLLHAEGEPVSPRLVSRVEQHRKDAEERLAVWTALVAGRYSLVEREERGIGRHYLLLDNPPLARERRKLTNIEATVVHDLARGMSSKTIAYSLGLSPAAISMAQTAASAKLGFLNKLEMARAIRGLLGHPAPHDHSQLTSAERAVLELLLAGGTNLQIAQRRGTSQRTVANQVASILKKTGADSRRALRIAR
jgi:DNA-binding NarL/FixJ family response regulator